ncbi:endothelin-converting enzyme homolog isoform X2 [Ostrea edulis]|uniref:endothelin-converting enzyme homolog isoform X2 n=1 Tax=Ostrea edulis TaxID=37623 RepID=UPI0024AF28F8|nr:endothelin-converting enzyme homolog isoform X2 [Ostrea edulis]
MNRKSRDSADLSNGVTESNELLSQGHTEHIMIKEFDRVDSEDDILGEYREECKVGSGCLRKRTGLEKCFGGFIMVLLIVTLALIIALAQRKSGTESRDVCETKECILAASSVLKSMDQSVNPCIDFYKYACGGWDRDTPIPPGYSMWDRIQELSYTNLHHLKDILEKASGLVTSDSGKKTKQFYQSCMSESRQRRDQTLANFTDLIKYVSSENFNFAVMLEKVHLLDAWPLFTVSVGPNEVSPEDGFNVVRIDYGYSQYPYQSFPKPSEPSVTVDTVPNNETTIPPPAASRQQTGSPTYLSWDINEIVKKFFTGTKQILRTVFNKTEQESESLSHSLLELEKKIGWTRDSEQHIHNRSAVYTFLKIKDLQRKCPMLTWDMYLLRILSKSNVSINDDTKIVVLHEAGLSKLCAIIDSYKTDKPSVLKYYLLMHLVKSFVPYFDVTTFDDEDADIEEEVENEGEHWRRCAFYTNRAFGFVTGAMYVNETEKGISVLKIQNLVKDIKLAFKDYLLNKIWMDASTRSHAEEKLSDMLEKISYPNEILKSHFLDQYYKEFEVSDDWFSNIKSMKTFRVTKTVEMFNKAVDRQSWIQPPVTVEADYSPERNDIMFPIAMFHLPFYSPNGPQALNFGAMGAVIGHEITHAFDITGRQYDSKGKLKEWWEPFTASQFEQTTQCMKDQYDGFTLGELQINGEKTLDENIADNGGLRAAYIAYNIWEHENGNSPPLPGVNLTDKQLFYVSYAQMFCTKWKFSGLRNYLLRDNHSPGPLRVKGSLQNSNTFGKVFNCPFISEYSPNIKCEVW